jgi:hypothetical protein
LKHAWWIAPVLGGGLLRLWGIDFGCPILSNLYIRPDESLVVVSGVELLKNAGAPGTFAYPALFIEMVGVLYHLMSGNPAIHFGIDPTPFFIGARVPAALFGTLTILLVFGLARHWMTRPWAALAATAYAVAPLAVRDAHFGVTDTPSVCFQTAAVWFALRYLEADPRHKIREFWCAATALALSMATKYAGLLLVSVLLSALWMRARRTGEPFPWRSLVAAGLAVTVLFIAVNPYMILEADKAWEEVWSILRILYGWQEGDPAWTLTSALRQIAMPLRYGSLGWLGVALAGAALAIGIRRRDVRLFLVAQPALSTFLVLLPFQHTVPQRYLLPALPVLALLCVTLTQMFSRPILRRSVGALLLVLIAGQAWTSLRFVRLLAMEDTRTLAGRWIQQNVPRSLPVVWLGGPECEPQYLESAASIARRIEFAYRRYGPVSGAIVSAPYRLMKAAAEREGRAGWEIHRNPPKGPLPVGEFLLVTAKYPLSMTHYEMPLPREKLETIGTVTTLRSLTPGVWDDLELDPIDAWFLPFRPLSGVLRPGPDLLLEQVRVTKF